VELLAARLGFRWRRPLFRRFLVACGRGGPPLLLVKPLTYMNRSGEIFPALWALTEGGLESLLVVCDTLDLPPGQCRLRRRGSSAGHRGLASLIDRLGGGNFMRLYIGIGRPAGGQEAVVAYVLSRPEGREAELLARAAAEAAEAILRLADEGPEKVMNALNQSQA